MAERRRFTPEFKRQAVQLLNAGQRPATELARELGIPPQSSLLNGRRTSPPMAARSLGLVGRLNQPPNSRGSRGNWPASPRSGIF